MSNARANTGLAAEPLTSAADSLGYGRPLPDRSLAAFSTNAAHASANGSLAHAASAGTALHNGMNQIAADLRWLPDRSLALKTILAFWSLRFALATARGLIMDYSGQAEMLSRRLAVTLLGIVLTMLIYLALRLVATSPIRVKIIVAAVLCFPGAAVFATFNYYMFYIDSPLEATWAVRNAGTENVVKLIADGTFSWYFFFAAWAAIYVALSYARQLRDADARSAALAREAQDAQLRALRYQINPHFLFNTLNSLSSLVLAGRNETAERMLMNLSAFFRTTLSADPTADVTLAEEIALQRRYLDVEQVRFPDRLLVEIDVPDRLLACHVPVLILQPIVENGVKYGVARSRGPVTIRIAAHEAGGRLHIVVSDDGDGGAVESGEGSGVGLKNVCDRLSARYGAQAGCDHGARPEGGYQVHLSVPMVTCG